MQNLIYSLKRTSKETFDFTTDAGVEYTIYLSSLNRISHLFVGLNNLSENNFYYLIIERKSHINVPTAHDLIVKRTVAACLFQFFTENKEAIVVFNYTNIDDKIEKRRAHFRRWFIEYVTETRFTFYQKDYDDFASICALYRRYSYHPNFIQIEEKIKTLVEQIGKDTSKS